MHVDHEEVEYVVAEEQDYEEVIEEYEEEIFVSEEFQEPPATNTSDFALAQGKSRCITLILQVFIYIFKCCAFTLQEFYDTHMHIYLPMSPTSTESRSCFA
jgi:hypothetical protein